MFGSGGYQERPIDIRVDPFLDCMHFVVLTMECGFYVLPQGISFACIFLLKFSLRESTGYLLYNIQGAIMQMTKSYVLKFTYIMALHFLLLSS